MKLLRVAFVAAALLGTAFGSWSACKRRRLVCDPGASQGCVCASGRSGAQVCADDGNRWEACECDPGGVEVDAGDEADAEPDIAPGDQRDEDPDGDANADADAPPECWRDPDSGLLWQVTPATSRMGRSAAVAYCDDLELCGFTDWVLPTIGELRSIIRGCANTETGGPCPATDTCTRDGCWNEACEGCPEEAGPDAGCYWAMALEGDCSDIRWDYWSSSFYRLGAPPHAC